MQPEQRLRRRSDFAEAYRHGRSWSSPALALRTRPNGGTYSRFGFAVGKRIGKAVVRNRLRRRLRAIVRGLPVEPGWDVVVVARGPAKGKDFGELRDALAALTGRAGILAPAGAEEGTQR